MRSTYIRFDPEESPGLYHEWLESEKRRVRGIELRQFWASFQNYFWPTRVQHLPILFTLISSILLGVFETISQTVFIVSLFAIFFGIIHVRQFLLFILLHYKTWLLELKPSFKTKLWFSSVHLVGSKLSNWYSGNVLLPKYPAPPSLKQSVDGFLSSMEPCVSDEKFKQISLLGQQFLSKEGPSLHTKLSIKALVSRNWLSQWWIDYGYLASRSEVYRGFMNGIGPNCKLCNNWMDTGGMVIHGTYKYFVHKLATRELPPLAARDIVPMEMCYLKNITGGCRIPRKSQGGGGVVIDSFQWTEPWREAYVIIHIKGRYFKLYLHDSSGNQLAPSVLSQLLQEMYNESVREPNDVDPCIFTYLAREKWATIYEIICSDSHNREMFQAVARAAFIVHLLDGIETFQDSLDSLGDTQLQMWCDRSLNIVINSGGYVYICCEHSHCDAVLLASLYSDMFLLGKTRNVENGAIKREMYPSNTYHPIFKELLWNLPEQLKGAQYSDIKSEIIQNPNLKIRLCVKRITVDKALIKANKMGPDSFFQSIIFWAYHRKHKKIVNSYQPATLMFFKEGRTENTRPVNKPKVEFVKQMDSPELSVGEKIELLRKSANYQHTQTRLASVGRGCDRHLMGLYIIAKGTNVESEFLDYVFSDGMDFPLCTSVSPTTLLPEARDLVENDDNADWCSIGGQFRPMSPEQYGIVYMTVCQNVMNITITDLSCSQLTNAFEMGETIESCFYEVFQMLHSLNNPTKMDRQ